MLICPIQTLASHLNDTWILVPNGLVREKDTEYNMRDPFTFEEERPGPDHFYVLFKSKCVLVDAWPLVQDIMLN